MVGMICAGLPSHRDYRGPLAQHMEGNLSDRANGRQQGTEDLPMNEKSVSGDAVY
jgi:hypothetical protein